MPIRQAMLRQLSASKNAAVERVIEAALVYAQGAEQLELAQVLLDRNRRAGWAALIRHFDRLDESLQQQLLSNPRDLFGPLRDTMEDADGNGRANGISIIRRTADPKLVFLLTEALADSRDAVRELAAASFLEAIRKYRHGDWNYDTPPRPDPAGSTVLVHESPDPHHLRRAVDFALRQFHAHRQTNAVLAALIFERQQDSTLWPLFADSHNDLTRAAAAILRQLTDPDLASAAFLALASPLRAAALAGLGAANDPAMADALAHESYRLLDPTLRAGVEGLSRTRLFAGPPRADEPTPWTPANWLDYFRLLDQLPLPPHEKLPWFLRMLDSLDIAAEQVAGRMLIVRAISALTAADTVGALVRITSDPVERVACLATRYLLRRRQSEWREHAPVVLGSPHPSVRRLLTQAISPGQFERLWHQYQKLPPAVQLTTTRALSEKDKEFGDNLKEKLENPESTEASQGLRMLQTLPNLGTYRDQIISLCAHPDHRVVSAAVKLIGRLQDPSLRDILEAAATHSDPRVRANAVEAMDLLHVADNSKQIFALLNSRFNRERANAIRAISQFDFTTARECLIKMLADPSPAHRISALWVVGQLNLMALVRQVGSMARRDPNTRVRQRAHEMLHAVKEAAATSADAQVPSA